MLLPSVFIFKGSELIMTIAKVLERIKKIKLGYELDNESLISYIDTAENMILNEIVRGREGEAVITANFGGYDVDTDVNTELFAPPGFERIYELYAATQIDLREEESERYINDMAAFRDVFLDLKRYWWQTHRQVKDYKYHMR